MAFHVACPLTCRAVCFCASGTSAMLKGVEAEAEFLGQAAKLALAWQQPSSLLVAGPTVEVLVPHVFLDMQQRHRPGPVSLGGEAGSPNVANLDEEGDKFLWDRREVTSPAPFKKGLLKASPARSLDLTAPSASLKSPLSKMAAAKAAVELQLARTEPADSDSLPQVLCQLCLQGEPENSKRAQRMLPCKQCGRKFHRNCLKIWGGHRDKFDWSDWVCGACRQCEACKKKENAHKVMCCKRCDKAYHSYCVQPPLKVVPKGPFLCPDHTQCQSCLSKVPGSGTSSRWFLSYLLCDACGRLFVKNKYCTVCLKVYRDSEATPMVCCDECEHWVHCSCDNISDAAYHAYQSNENLAYKCPADKGLCFKVKSQEDAVAEMWRRRDAKDAKEARAELVLKGMPPEPEPAPVKAPPPSDDDSDDAYVPILARPGKAFGSVKEKKVMKFKRKQMEGAGETGEALGGLEKKRKQKVLKIQGDEQRDEIPEQQEEKKRRKKKKAVVQVEAEEKANEERKEVKEMKETEGETDTENVEKKSKESVQRKRKRVHLDDKEDLGPTDDQDRPSSSEHILGRSAKRSLLQEPEASEQGEDAGTRSGNVVKLRLMKKIGLSDKRAGEKVVGKVLLKAKKDKKGVLLHREKPEKESGGDGTDGVQGKGVKGKGDMLSPQRKGPRSLVKSREPGVAKKRWREGADDEKGGFQEDERVPGIEQERESEEETNKYKKVKAMLAKTKRMKKGKVKKERVKREDVDVKAAAEEDSAETISAAGDEPVALAGGLDDSLSLPKGKGKRTHKAPREQGRDVTSVTLGGAGGKKRSHMEPNKPNDVVREILHEGGMHPTRLKIRTMLSPLASKSAAMEAGSQVASRVEGKSGGGEGTSMTRPAVRRGRPPKKAADEKRRRKDEEREKEKSNYVEEVAVSGKVDMEAGDDEETAVSEATQGTKHSPKGIEQEHVQDSDELKQEDQEAADVGSPKESKAVLPHPGPSSTTANNAADAPADDIVGVEGKSSSVQGVVEGDGGQSPVLRQGRRATRKRAAAAAAAALKASEAGIARPIPEAAALTSGAKQEGLEELERLGRAANGKVVDVFWPEDKTWYRGRLREVKPAKKTFAVHYDDGAKETLRYGQEKIRFLPPDSS